VYAAESETANMPVMMAGWTSAGSFVSSSPYVPPAASTGSGSAAAAASDAATSAAPTDDGGERDAGAWGERSGTARAMPRSASEPAPRMRTAERPTAGARNAAAGAAAAASAMRRARCIFC
jgi:hypothetical protein